MNRYLAGSLLCLALASSQSFAGVPRSAADPHGKLASEIEDPELRQVTARLLREKGRNYKKEAIKILRADGEYFDHGRVEVTGFMSSDNTDESNPSIADKQIKPSFSVEGSAPRLENAKKWLQWGIAFPGIAGGSASSIAGGIPPAVVADISLDYLEVTAAMRGETTARAKAKLASYKNKEIEELAAHSWGTELVYAAILNGEIRPPKKLIVTGVPDDDRWKWESLAARTGTEVHWVRAPNDLVAAGGAKLAKFVTRDVDFLAKWAAACSARPETCPAHSRQTEGVIFEEIGDNPGTLGHDRLAYFDILMQAEHPIMGTRDELRSAQDARVAAATREVEQSSLEDALGEAREIVAQARAQAEIARGDHDQRLRDAYLSLAERTCAFPGSVTQAELDALPPPRKKESVDTTFYGLGDCPTRVYEQLTLGANADDLRRTATPVVAVDAKPWTPTVVASVTPAPAFSYAFPELKDYAIRACQSPDQIRFESILIPYYDYSFAAYDNDLARSMAAGMHDCSYLLFYKLIEYIRADYWNQTDPRWVRSIVASYSVAAPGNSNGNYAPPSGGGRTGGSEGGTIVTPPPPPAHDAEGEALRQLQEIERRKRWNLRPVL